MEWATAAVAAIGSGCVDEKNGYCHQQFTARPARAISATTVRRENMASPSANAAMTMNHGTKNSTSGIYGSACKSAGNARNTICTSTASVSTPLKAPTSLRLCRNALAFGLAADLGLGLPAFAPADLPPLFRLP